MIDLFKPYMPPKLPLLNDILHSGNLAYGKWARQFEKQLCQYIQVDNLMVTTSYGMALQVLLASLGIKPGDEVILSPIACLQSTQPLASFGMKLVWADIDPNTGTLDPTSVKSKITSRTKIILHNHFCGYVGYIDEINELGKGHGIITLDDCLEAFGSEYKGKLMGNQQTDISIFSFQTIRLPNSIDGGALNINNDALFKKALKTRDLGIDRSIFRDEHGEISCNCDIPSIGYAATPNDVNSYIGAIQMKDIDPLISIQRQNAIAWEEVLSEKKGIRPLQARKGINPNYWIYGVLSDNKIEDMLGFREQGFYSSSVHVPNNIYSIFGKNDVRLSGVRDFYNKFIAIPSGWWVNTDQIKSYGIQKGQY